MYKELKFVKAGTYFYELSYTGSGKQWYIYQRQEDGSDKLIDKYPYHMDFEAKARVRELNGWTKKKA